MPRQLAKDNEQLYHYSILGGISTLVDALVAVIEAHGGKVFTSRPVAKIQVEVGCVTGVVDGGGDFIPADAVIASGGAKETFFKLVGEEHLPADFAANLRSLPVMDSVFMLHLGMDFDPSPYLHGPCTYFYGTTDLEGSIAEAKSGIFHEGKAGFCCACAQPALPRDGSARAARTIIFESDTPGGMRFDMLLLTAIVTSVIVVMLDSVESFSSRHERLLSVLEWMFTLLFTVEYLARLACVERPLRYAGSFFGIIDLVSVLPTYLAIFVPELHALIDIRGLRMLRVFRILKLTEYVAEYRFLGAALRSRRRKILVFLSAVMMIVVSMGTIMYVVEGPANGFTSVPVSVYWAITTMTTVGFGDITIRH